MTDTAKTEPQLWEVTVVAPDGRTLTIKLSDVALDLTSVDKAAKITTEVGTMVRTLLDA